MDAREFITIGMSAERTLVVPPERTVGHILPGIPMVPLLIRYSEVPLGVNHPLRISFPSPTNSWVWPGTGCCGGSGPPQGLLYRLKASVNIAVRPSPGITWKPWIWS